MKKYLSFSGVLFVCAVLAAPVSAQVRGGQPTKKETPPNKEMTVEQLKANITSDIDARIKMLQTDRSCVSAAKTKEDLKKCVQLAGEKRKQLKQKSEARREQRKKDK